MKLNLSPPKDPGAIKIKQSLFFLGFLSLICAGTVLGMVQYSTYRLQEVRDRYDQLYDKVEGVKGIIYRTDRLWKGSEELSTNIKLYHVIADHNKKGIELIEQITHYIPSFFRVTSIQIYPNDKMSCQVQISGVLKTYQEYANLMVFLMQMPNVEKAFRLPVVLKDGKTESFNQETTALSLDPVEKLATQIALAQPSIVNPLMGHKIGTPFPPLHKEGSEVSVVLVVRKPYKAPNVRFTLSGVSNESIEGKK